MCVCLCVRVRVCTHTHAHTHTHIYIYKYLSIYITRSIYNFAPLLRSNTAAAKGWVERCMYLYI